MRNRGNREEITSVKLAFFITFNAMVVQEALASFGHPGVEPLSSRPIHRSIKEWLISHWTSIQANINYEPVFSLAVRVLKMLPSHPVVEETLKGLARIASEVVSSRALLKHDIAGRIYHMLLLRRMAKGLATYYTSIPGAYLLAKLAVETPGLELDVEGDEVDVVADLACGSGTLLSAAYSAILDSWIKEKVNRGAVVSDEDIYSVHKKILEKMLFGFDVLDYAVHLAAAWLTLRMPEVEVDKINIYSLPLGRELNQTWLGSLSMEIDKEKGICHIPLATSLIEEFVGAEAITLRERRREPVVMPTPKLIIMNPPFARTGNVGHSILFGHLREEEREAVLKEMRKLLNKISDELGGAVGKAGLAPPFIWLSSKALVPGGRMAFVLPRVALSGASWEPIRRLLANDYRVDHIVVCYDPKYNWAWSENTVLSEILLICSDSKKERDDGLVKVTYVYKRPKSALEAKLLASKILEYRPKSRGEAFAGGDVIELGRNRVAKIYCVSQKTLTEQANWNMAVGFASRYLSQLALSIHEDNRS